MELDWIIVRKKLKKQILFWRTFAVLAVIALIIFQFGSFDTIKDKNHIAVLNVSNIITDNPKRSKALIKVANDDLIKALIVNIDSPGGTVVGGEALYLHLREVSSKKPVVAVISDLATSAGYMTAIAADKIFARQSSITGSIGVIIQTTDITVLLDKIGIKPEAIKSSPLKIDER